MAHCGRFADALSRGAKCCARRPAGSAPSRLRRCPGERSFGEITAAPQSQQRGAAAGLNALRFAPKVRNVIFLYMDGGPSQVDTFDPKPRLDGENGQPIKVKIQPTQFNNDGNMLGSPWKFRQYGESGMPVSDLFPHVARLRRRAGDRPLDGVGIFRAHQRQLLPAHRQRPAGPAEHGSLGDLRPGQRVPGPARLRRAQRRPDSARRHRQFQQRLSAGDVSGRRSSSRRAEPLANIRAQRAAARAAAATSWSCCASSTGRCSSASGTTIRSRRRSPTTSWPFGCRRPCPS